MQPLLTAEGLSKRYGNVQALRDVSVSFLPGEIHAVLGENGAGKSTLMGVLAGFVPPDAGSVSMGGSAVPLGRAFAVKHLGIEMVHQHFMLVPAFTVAENLALARVSSLAGAADVLALARPALDLARSLGWELEPTRRTGDLPVGVQQRIEIVKALAGDARVLILDEPTAVLSSDEVAELFRVLRSLRDSGRAVILIAHKLREVLSVADRVTVLRQGSVVASALVPEVSERQLAEWMVGDLPGELTVGERPLVEPFLIVEGLDVLGDRGEMAVRGVSFDVGRGEILGIGGVDGNGQVELAEALAGVRSWSGGLSLGPMPRVAYIPQDRQNDGLALNMSVQDNLLVSGHRSVELTRGPFLLPVKVRDWARGLVERFGIKAGSPGQAARTLSGGNQQKIVVARTLSETPDLLVAVNPTRGLDVRATDYVHVQILKAAEEGAAVVLFSTDLDELAALAHRTLFMSGGELREASAESLVGGSG